MAKTPARIPFEFVLDELAPLAPRTKPMFGAQAVYVRGDTMVFLMREKEQDEDDGIWLLTTQEHHETLRRDLPSIRSIKLFETPVTSWQIIPSSGPDFEREVVRACALVLRGDERIGTSKAIKDKQKAAAKAAKSAAREAAKQAVRAAKAAPPARAEPRQERPSAPRARAATSNPTDRATKSRALKPLAGAKKSKPRAR